MTAGRTTYVQDASGKFIEKVRTHNRVHAVMDDSIDFISPIDGSHISGNRQLREHNKRHGVSNDLDSLKSQAQQSLARDPAGGQRKERTTALLDSWDRTQSSGFSREIKYDE